MNKKEKIPVIVVTALLILFCVLILTGSALLLINSIFIASPFLIIWMVYSVIRFGEFTGKELKENEEWGYADKRKDGPGIL